MDNTLERARKIADEACAQWSCIIGKPELVMHRENTVYKIATTTGPAALRVHRHGYHDKHSIKSEMQWMAYLSKSGLLIPAPIANVAQRYLTEVKFDNEVIYVDLLTWLQGTPLGKSAIPLVYDGDQLTRIFFNLGAAIARLHNISDSWTLPAGFRRPAWDHDGFLGEAPIWGAFWNAAGLASNERQVLLAARAKAASELVRLREAGLDYGLIHADLTRENILVNGTEPSLIDFDDSGFGFRMFDFATALVRNRGEPHFGAMKQALFAGYRTARPLAKRDEDCLGLFIALRDFAFLGWLDARRNEPGSAERFPKIRQDAIAAARNFLETPYT